MFGAIYFPINRQRLFPQRRCFVVSAGLVEKHREVIQRFSSKRVVHAEGLLSNLEILSHRSLGRGKVAAKKVCIGQRRQRLGQDCRVFRAALAVGYEGLIAQLYGFRILFQLYQHIGERGQGAGA